MLVKTQNHTRDIAMPEKSEKALLKTNKDFHVANKNSKSQKQLNYNQRMFLLCFPKSGFNIAKTCRIIGITRKMFKKWLRENSLFKEKFEDSNEEQLDFVESVLFQNIQHQNKFVSNVATIFYLKTKGKKRGYIERPELNINLNDKRSKDEIDAIVRAAEQTDDIVIDAQVVQETTPNVQIPENSES